MTAFDLELDVPPIGASVTGALPALGVPERTWHFESHGHWVTRDGCGRPELMARPFTEAGRAITALWVATGHCGGPDLGDDPDGDLEGYDGA